MTVRRLRAPRTVSLPTKGSMSTTRTTDAGGSPGNHVVLILSSDAVAAALLGALVETLGYLVRFYHPPESPDEALRRERPSVAMVDCDDPTMMNDELLGRARMRGVSVVMFGSRDALRQVRQLALEHQLDTLLMPTSLDELDETLRKAIKQAC
jgi:DNA-binding NtrC family response regulator